MGMRFALSATICRVTHDQERAITMKMPSNLGMILLAVWLIVFGVLTAPFLKFSFSHSGDVLAALAVAAGVVLLIQRR